MTGTDNLGAEYSVRPFPSSSLSEWMQRWMNSTGRRLIPVKFSMTLWVRNYNEIETERKCWLCKERLQHSVSSVSLLCKCSNISLTTPLLIPLPLLFTLVGRGWGTFPWRFRVGATMLEEGGRVWHTWENFLIVCSLSFIWPLVFCVASVCFCKFLNSYLPQVDWFHTFKFFTLCLCLTS